MQSYLHRFMKAAKRAPVKKVVWITPPDSAKFRNVQGTFRQIIRDVARDEGVSIVESRTRYKMGKTGNDGIHYNTESSQEWAQQIQKDLDSKVVPPEPSRRLSKFKTDDTPGGSQYRRGASRPAARAFCNRPRIARAARRKSRSLSPCAPASSGSDKNAGCES
jgi:hypothetical protein